MKHMELLTVTITVTVLAMAPLTKAEVPQVINYQGRLTDTGGAPLDTTEPMIFTVYAAASPGF